MKFFVSSVFATLVVSGCDLVEHRSFHDPNLKLSKKDYQELLKPPVVKRPRYIKLPQTPKVATNQEEVRIFQRKVSINLHDGISLKSIFLELSRQTGVGLVLSPKLSTQGQGITYSAKRLPMIEVIKDICNLTDLRYQIQGNRILIEPDEPYVVTYNVQALSQTRQSENRISVSTDVFAPMESHSRTDNGSESLLTGKTLMDFWDELEGNMKVLLGSGNERAQVTFHKQGGLVTVLGTSRQQAQIYSYLDTLKKTTSSQVLIEAKILEVTLDNEYKTGINWSQLGGEVELTAPFAPLTLPQQRDVFTLAVDHKNFSSVLKLVNKFGTVRTLSNPRLTVMNNQPAMLKVATNEVFFHIEFERYFQAEGKPDIENISSDAITVPIGLVLVVQPSVNQDTGEITMTLRPTLSRVQKEVEDPAVAIKSRQQVKSRVPVVQVRELDSVLKMKSGQVIVMGGLMEDRASYSTNSVPGLGSLPIIGELVTGKEDEHIVTELVIFLTAHIVEEPITPPADERLYNTFTEDPRPLPL